ncbi:hypothetical protein HanRHA438_Chr00c06g0846191 [Helianthus annuus]|nr:hypothetical protein HanRHA438_Chr00c06g0846191 [Helianthus annuus]
MIPTQFRLLCASCSRHDAKLLSSRGSHWKQPLYFYGVEVIKVVYILSSSDPTLALLLVDLLSMMMMMIYHANVHIFVI